MFALVENQTVIGLADQAQGFVLVPVAIPPGQDVQVGDRYDGQAFTRPRDVPAEVWTYQAKTVMALTTLESLGLSGAAFGLAAGATLYDAVLAAIATLPDQARTVAMIQLESAPGTQRNAPLLAALSEPLGLTSAMIDQLFIAAAAIP